MLRPSLATHQGSGRASRPWPRNRRRCFNDRSWSASARRHPARAVSTAIQPHHPATPARPRLAPSKVRRTRSWLIRTAHSLIVTRTLRSAGHPAHGLALLNGRALLVACYAKQRERHLPAAPVARAQQRLSAPARARRRGLSRFTAITITCVFQLSVHQRSIFILDRSQYFQHISRPIFQEPIERFVMLKQPLAVLEPSPGHHQFRS